MLFSSGESAEAENEFSMTTTIHFESLENLLAENE